MATAAQRHALQRQMQEQRRMASLVPCPHLGHVSLMSGLFCILNPRERSYSKTHLRLRSSDSFGSLIPAGSAIPAQEWQMQAYSMLFQLPFEIITLIAEEMDILTLGNFALTCRASNHFAKWRQFQTSVVSSLFVPEQVSSHLRRLYREALIITNNTSMMMNAFDMPRLGPSIRKLVVRTESQSFILPDDDTEKDKAATTLYGRHLQTLAFVIKYALPNLRALRFEDCAPIPRGMWNVVLQSGIQELDLFNCYIGNPIEPPIPPNARIWPLTSLTVGDIGTRGMHSLPRGGFALRPVTDDDVFLTQLLGLCAPTLKTLRLMCCSKSLAHQHEPFELSRVGNISFPRLKEIELDLYCFNRDLYRALTIPSPEIQALSLGLSADIPNIAALHSRTPVAYPSLRYLAALAKDSAIYNLAGPLQSIPTACPLVTVLPLLLNPENHGITNLQLEQDYRVSHTLQQHILPLLSANFKQLTSLSLTLTQHARLDGGKIDAATLPLVGTITTLQQLRIQVVGADPRRHNWEINHKEIRQHLSELRFLRRLAFVGDTYPVPKGLTASDYSLEHVAETGGAIPYDDAQDDTPLPPGYFDDFSRSFPRSNDSSAIHPTLLAGMARSQTHVLSYSRNGPPLMSCRVYTRRRMFEVDSHAWREEHMNRMCRHARNYFVQWQGLEWVHFGNLLMLPPRAPASSAYTYEGKGKSKAEPVDVLYPIGADARNTSATGEARGYRPRVVGWGAGDRSGENHVDAYLDWVFGWKSFVPRGLEEWAGVGVDYESLVFADT